jgi:hypothetical protein
MFDSRIIEFELHENFMTRREEKLLLSFFIGRSAVELMLHGIHFSEGEKPQSR